MARSASKQWYRRLLLFGLILLGLYAARPYEYLLFHSIAEIFSIVIAASLFLFAWNTQEFSDNDYPLLLGIAFIGIAGVDLLHTLAYAGMDLFRGYDKNLLINPAGEEPPPGSTRLSEKKHPQRWPKRLFGDSAVVQEIH